MKTIKTTFRNLITNSMNTNQIKKVAICILVVLSTIACKKENVETNDTTFSKVEFTFTGDGISKTFYSDSTYMYGQLNLKPNTTYTISVRGTDNCCMKKMVTSALTSFTYTSFTSTPTNTISSFGFVKSFTIADSTTTPRFTTFSLNGSVKTPRIPVSGSSNSDFLMISYDFKNNRTELRVPFHIENAPAQGFGWVSI